MMGEIAQMMIFAAAKFVGQLVSLDWKVFFKKANGVCKVGPFISTPMGDL